MPSLPRLPKGETIKGSAERCGIAPSTAHRWRHRFLAAVRQVPDRLAGIVEADETFVLESRKGERKLDTRINLHILHPRAGDGVFGCFFSGF